VAKQRTSTDDLSIPPFLLRTQQGRVAGRRRASPVVAAGAAYAERPPVDPALPLPPGLYWSKTSAEEAGFFTGRGAVPRRWAAPDTVAAIYDAVQHRLAKREEGLARLRDLPRAVRVDPLAGKTALRAVLSEIGENAPSYGRARKAIDESKVLHSKYHFDDKDLPKVRQVLSALASQPAPKGGGLQIDTALRLRVLKKDVPHGAESKAYKNYLVIAKCDGKTIGEFLKAGGNLTLLRYHVQVKKTHVKLEKGK
jgi:hypothetical protein